MRNALIGLAILSLAQGAEAAGWTQPGPRGEIAREGKAFVCNGLNEAKGKKLPAVDCLYIGALAVGMGEAALKEALGLADDIRTDRTGATHYVYLRMAGDVQKFVAATVVGGVVVAGHIYGPEPIDGFAFNEINLGTEAATVKAKFGEPTKVSPSDIPDAEKWSYAPANFSFEMADGAVIAIRVATDAHR